MEEHPQARTIVETLTRAGYTAYYAGGWVRDLLLGHPSDDIDIATDAPPAAVQQLFANTVPIGLAFGIILVLIEGREYEVASFRSDADYIDGRRPTQVHFTTAQEDAKRRDFTINGMFYDPLKGEVLDYVGGREDLDKKLIRAIGNPHARIREDRLRMIRAIRLACRFHFAIDPPTAEAIRAHATELFPAVAIERVVQELNKGLQFRKLPSMLIRLHEFALLPAIFPALKTISLEEVQERLKAALHFPPNAPLIAFLLELFPNLALAAQIDLCASLKLSNAERQFAIFLHSAKTLIENIPRTLIELVQWAHLYAHPSSDTALQIIAAPLDKTHRAEFLKEHEERQQRLSHAIERIRTNRPLIKAATLAALGIPPGKTMGILLKEAERIAINDELQDQALVLEKLRQHPVWPRVY